MKQITIYDLIPLLNGGYVAMDEDGNWKWYALKPKMFKRSKNWMDKAFSYLDLYQFNIAPFDGDWKDSLIKVEHRGEE